VNEGAHRGRAERRHRGRLRRATPGAHPPGPRPGLPTGRAADLLPWGPLDPAGRPDAGAHPPGVGPGADGARAGVRGAALHLRGPGADADRGGSRSVRGRPGDPRILSMAYLALVREGALPRRHPGPGRRSTPTSPGRTGATGAPISSSGSSCPASDGVDRRPPGVVGSEERQDRAAVGFGLFGSDWDGDRVLERYELLYGAGLVPEALRDRGRGGKTRSSPGGTWGRTTGGFWPPRWGGSGEDPLPPRGLRAPPATLHPPPAPAGGGGPLRGAAPQAELPEPGGAGRARGGDRGCGGRTGGRPAELFRFRRRSSGSAGPRAWGSPGPERGVPPRHPWT
jgi:hypothetical protein